jgi:hypothetical protein
LTPLIVDGTFLEFLYKIWRTGVLYYQTDRLKKDFLKKLCGGCGGEEI